MDILTQRNNTGRTGVNDGETALTPQNVNINTFGKLHQVPINRGGIYAQPLYVGQLNHGAKGVHDTVFVATMQNFVVSIDANTGAVILAEQIDGLPPVTSQTYFGNGYHDIVGGNPTIGVLSTPAIDVGAQEIYLVLYTVDNNAINAPGTSDAAKAGAFKYILCVIDLVTLKKKRAVSIQGSVPGTGYTNSKYFKKKTAMASR